MLNAAGRSSEAYPHLYKALDNGGNNGADGLDSVHLVDSGQTASGKATASVLACSGSNNMISGGHLMIFDGDSGELLAEGENTSVRSGSHRYWIKRLNFPVVLIQFHCFEVIRLHSGVFGDRKPRLIK